LIEAKRLLDLFHQRLETSNPFQEARLIYAEYGSADSGFFNYHSVSQKGRDRRTNHVIASRLRWNTSVYVSLNLLKDSSCPLIARSVGSRSIDEAPKKP